MKSSATDFKFIATAGSGAVFNLTVSRTEGGIAVSSSEAVLFNGRNATSFTMIANQDFRLPGKGRIAYSGTRSGVPEFQVSDGATLKEQQ